MHLLNSGGLWNKLKAMRLTDLCLLVFMVVLMGQTAFHLLLANGTEMTETFGTVVRTTKAAIFGYFIGSGFLANKGAASDVQAPPPQQMGGNTSPAQARAQIGFQAESDTAPTLNQPNAPQSKTKKTVASVRNLQQVVIVTGIGLYSLILLMIAQYNDNASASVATLSQLRDFLSGSVGLLIGHSSNGD